MAHSFERSAPAGESHPPIMKLKDTALLREQCFIDGRWIGADDGGTIDVQNPATFAKLGTIPRMGAAETRRAIRRGAAALGPWAAKTAKERAMILRRWFELIMQNQQDLAT
jgi:succinate-semialdehyde dehydrogenase/glutarate-semialdehyde dehydrogenase